MSFEGIIEFVRKNLMIALSVVVIAGCMTVYTLHLGKKSDLDSEIDQLNIRISTMLKNIKNSKGLEEDIAAIEEQIEALDERMFHAQELATNYNYFYNIEAATDIEVNDLRQIGIVEEKVDPRKRRLPKPVVNSYVKIRYHMKATGRYGELVNFMRKLEGGPSFYRLEKFKLSRPSSAGIEELSMDVSFLMLGKKPS